MDKDKKISYCMKKKKTYLSANILLPLNLFREASYWPGAMLCPFLSSFIYSLNARVPEKEWKTLKKE